MRSKRRLPARELLVGLGIPLVFIPGLMLAALLGWNWQSDLSRLARQGGYYQAEELFPVRAKVVAVVDADTLALENGQVVRLLGVDAPNRGKAGYKEAQELMESLVLGKTVELEYDAYQDDKFGRLLAYVFVDCTMEKGCQEGKLMVNKVLLREGLGELVIYEKRRKLKYEEELREIIK